MYILYIQAFQNIKLSKITNVTPFISNSTFFKGLGIKIIGEEAII